MIRIMNIMVELIQLILSVKAHCRRPSPLLLSIKSLHPSPSLPPYRPVAPPPTHTLSLIAIVFLCVSGSLWMEWRCPGQTYASAATEWLSMRETNTTSPTHRGTASVSVAALRLRARIDPRHYCLTITRMIPANFSISIGESYDYAASQRARYQ